MKVVSDLGKIKYTKQKIVLAIGVFDGLHVGHQLLIRKAIERARAVKGLSVVLTFSPHPVKCLYPRRKLSLVVSLEHRIFLLAQMGVDVCCVIPFNKKFSQITYDQFICSHIMKKISPCEICVGDDFRFGRDRGGSAHLLSQVMAQRGIKVCVLHDVERSGVKISSTDIRQAISNGDLLKAKRLLGRTFGLMGPVRKGRGLGARLGYPTANIYPQGVVLPPSGVYASRAVIDNKEYAGMAYVGKKPVSSGGKKVNVVENHVFDLNRDLYGRRIIVQFLKWMRADLKFKSNDALVRQIQADEKKIRQYLKRAQ